VRKISADAPACGQPQVVLRREGSMVSLGGFGIACLHRRRLGWSIGGFRELLSVSWGSVVTGVLSVHVFGVRESRPISRVFVRNIYS
jgi:hypothetical protein